MARSVSSAKRRKENKQMPGMLNTMKLGLWSTSESKAKKRKDTRIGKAKRARVRKTTR